MAQMSAIELHVWGATERDPTHPDQIVFDLDPGEDVDWPLVIAAAYEVRGRLRQLGLAAFCRTTGGKGLHVVSPLKPRADWDRVKLFCRAFAEAMAQDVPDRYVAHVKIADRRGKILVDWLRNAIGATAVASFCPRARPGAHVATPVTWDEVTDALDPSSFTIRSIRDRVAALQADPWDGFEASRQALPDFRLERPAARVPRRAAKPGTKPVIVVAAPPWKRS
jgi:bifunctional non-homologous end joining protein LigD